jgi:hypothetical protein
MNQLWKEGQVSSGGREKIIKTKREKKKRKFLRQNQKVNKRKSQKVAQGKERKLKACLELHRKKKD